MKKTKKHALDNVLVKKNFPLLSTIALVNVKRSYQMSSIIWLFSVISWTGCLTILDT